MAQQEEAFSGWVDTTQFTYWRLPIYRFQAQKWWGNGNLKSGEGSLQDANQGCNPTLSRLLPARHCYCLQPYTKKQWAKYPAQLDAEVFTRLPYREDNDDRCSPQKNVTELLLSIIVVSDTLMTPGSTCPRMATPPCLRTYCWRTPRSLSGWAWTTSSEEGKWQMFCMGSKIYPQDCWLLARAWSSHLHWTHWCLLCQ